MKNNVVLPIVTTTPTRATDRYYQTFNNIAYGLMISSAALHLFRDLFCGEFPYQYQVETHNMHEDTSKQIMACYGNESWATLSRVAFYLSLVIYLSNDFGQSILTPLSSNPLQAVLERIQPWLDAITLSIWMICAGFDITLSANPSPCHTVVNVYKVNLQNKLTQDQLYWLQGECKYNDEHFNERDGTNHSILKLCLWSTAILTLVKMALALVKLTKTCTQQNRNRFFVNQDTYGTDNQHVLDIQEVPDHNPDNEYLGMNNDG